MEVEQAVPGGSLETERPQSEPTGQSAGAVQVIGEIDDAPPKGVKVVAVDARSERRLVMRRLLEHSFAPEEIAEADSRETAVELVDRYRPGVVVIEIQMPLAEGLETVGALSRMSPRPRIVVCSFRCDAPTIQVAVEAGADVYVTKPASVSDLRTALWPIPAERPPPRHRPPNERPVSPTLSQLQQVWRGEGG